MTKVTKTANRGRVNIWRIRWTVDRKRKTITWKGSEDEAETARVHVAHLLDCDKRKQPPHRSTMDWLSQLSDSDHSKLVGIGGTVAREQAAPAVTLRVLYDSFLASKSSMKDATKATYRQAWTVLSKRFGESRAIETITTADARAFRDWLATEGNQRDNDREDLDVNTVRRRVGICRQIFKHGIESKWITENPFKGIAAAVHANPERFHYVRHDDFKRMIDFAPDATMRAVITLNRLIGCRIPTEIKTLKWSDVDLSEDNGHLRIKAPKTEHHRNRGLRTAPVLPALRPYLEDLQTLAQPGIETPLSAPLFPRFAETSDSAIRSAVLKIMGRAGIEPWPNLFSNGRKSAITDLLAAGHNVADVAAWVGNSPAVIWEYYAMATEESRRRAAAVRPKLLSSDIDHPAEGPAEELVHDESCVPIGVPNPGAGPSCPEPSGPQNTDKKKPAESPRHRENAGGWAMRDSNPRHSRCKRDALAN